MTTHLITLASGTLACCGKTPFEVPRGDRCTTDPDLATCVGGDVGPCDGCGRGADRCECDS